MTDPNMVFLLLSIYGLLCIVGIFLVHDKALKEDRGGKGESPFFTVLATVGAVIPLVQIMVVFMLLIGCWSKPDGRWTRI